MANTMQLDSSVSVAGLGTTELTIVSATQIEVDVKTTIPPSSGVAVAIKKNGSNVITPVGGASTNPTPTQASIGASAQIQCAAADVITIVLSSSAAADQIPNAVKSVISLYQIA